MAKKRKKNKTVSNVAPNLLNTTWKKVWALVIALGIVGTLIVTIWQIQDHYKSPLQKHKEETTLEGQVHAVHLPPTKFNIDSTDQHIQYKLSDSAFTSKATIIRLPAIYIEKFFLRPIKLSIGFHSINIKPEEFTTGVSIMKLIWPNTGEFGVKLSVKDDSLYVSADFKDLYTEFLIGRMQLNRWFVNKETALNPQTAADKFQVEDKRGDVVFSLRYRQEKDGSVRLFIAGYFISETHIAVVLSDNSDVSYQCFDRKDTNCLEKVRHTQKFIKSIFP